MVKSKKLSKSSLAVIILSLLLILSMIVGMTAAWFVDSGSGKDDDNALTFGKVNISGVGATVTSADGVDMKHVLPGDSWTLAGAVSAEKADVDMWVLVTPKTTFKIGETECTELYSDEGKKNSVMAYTALAMTTATGWTEDKTVTTTGGAVLYHVTAAAGAATLSGSVAFDAKMPNVVYNQTGARIVLNDTFDTAATVSGSLAISLDVKAIQYKGVNASQALYALTTGWSNGSPVALKP